jgi:hypothetical protein
VAGVVAADTLRFFLMTLLLCQVPFRLQSVPVALVGQPVTILGLGVGCPSLVLLETLGAVELQVAQLEEAHRKLVAVESELMDNLFLAAVVVGVVRAERQKHQVRVEVVGLAAEGVV